MEYDLCYTWHMSRRMFALQEDVFKVLANEKRLEIIQLLRHRELNVSEMMSMLGLRQANLSQNLALLREYKLVTVTKRGREVYYKLTDDNIAKAVQIIQKFLQAQYQIDRAPQPDSVFPIVVDPVCRMRLSASEAFDHTEYDGRDYYFCASGCKESFMARADRYILATSVKHHV